MPRHGRLSKGCQICRKRKIKCDQARPSCSQCRRSGWKCPQYDLVDRMFQREDVGKTVQSTDEFDRPRPRSTSGSAPNAIIAANETQHCLSRGLPKEVIPSINDLAINFFLSTHVFHDTDGALRGYYEYLPVLRDQTKSHNPLSESLNAVALAAYAYTFRQPDLLVAAKRYYSYVLRHISAALLSPIDAIRDTMIASILLLSTYETLCMEDMSWLSHCIAHIKGAMLVTNIRPHHIMTTRHGLQLFLHMYRCLIMNCLLRSTRVPVELINLRSCASNNLDTNDPAWKLLDICVKVAQFRADVKECIIREDKRIVNKALEIDRGLAALADGMPPRWEFQIIPVKQNSKFACEPHCHVYSDLWMAAIWNNIRTCRLLLYREVCAQFKDRPIYEKATNDFIHQHANHILEHMASEICATVPQYCGQLPEVIAELKKDERNGAFNSSYMANIAVSGSVPTTAGVYFLFWPLYNAGQATKSDIQKKWIIDRSRHLGRTTGIQQALVLADVLERGEELPF
ncbi:hypothetical protein BDV25DRAFT_30284 [Aspergillus avenaceus]|uniref:Zn(2)-C6 fungal-type domain-containing protein n=1 Tax=Aspergillus avenaceus TaxID=36643 RepID=A0A5N6TMJ8_ASPAV|nr:hypothetical protein BDV25DRAFT_30284 [Aspergillus avenaceus]